jgi:hypothetical protein
LAISSEPFIAGSGPAAIAKAAAEIEEMQTVRTIRATEFIFAPFLGRLALDHIGLQLLASVSASLKPFAGIRAQKPKSLLFPVAMLDRP